MLKTSAESFEGLEVGSKPRIAGMLTLFGDKWCVYIEKVRERRVVSCNKTEGRREKTEG